MKRKPSLAWVKRNLYQLLFCLVLFFYTLCIFILLPPSPSICNDCNKKMEHTTFISFVYQAKMAPNAAQHLFDEFQKHPISLKSPNVGIIITRTAEPKWPLQFKNTATLSHIQRTLEKINYHRLKVSYQLQNGQWLNYLETPSFSYLYYILLFIVLMIILTLLTAFFVIINLISASLKNVKHSASKLGLDMYAKIDTGKGLPMVHGTVSTMKNMQQRIQELVNHNAKLLGAISHDLRTPITRIKLRSSLIKDEGISKKIALDTEEIETMISELLSYTKNAAYKEKKKLTNINGLLLLTCYDFMDMGYNIQLDGLDSYLPISIAENSMKRCFNNILSNAFKFADKVQVTSKMAKEKIIITIKDNGPGIPESELEKVIKPFYRTSEGKKASSTGAGLGLSIVSEAMRYHNAEIQLLNRIEGGLSVQLIFNT